MHKLGLTTALTDASAHLDFSKFLSQSLTPGISQIGFWPPLLQIVMAPWVAISYLYKTGLAGYFAILPFLCVGIVAFYRLVRRLTSSQALGITAALLVLANPYFLYYSSVPMMEVLYVSNLFIATYSLIRWLQDHEIRHLIWLGVFVTLTSLSRYEGLLLIPLVGLILLLDLYRRKTQRSQMEATLLLFGMLAIVGALFILIYSWVFGGSPLAFDNTSWIRDPSANLGITKHHILTTIKYLASGSYYSLSKIFTWLAVISFALSLFGRKMRFERLAAMACLISPLLFVAATLFAGTDSVLTPNLYPYNFFHNDRYTLTWIGFAILAPMLMLSNLLVASQRFRWSRSLALSIVSVAATVLVLYSGYNTYQVAYVQRYPAIQHNINGPIDPQRQDQVNVADYLQKNYDFGNILMERSNEDPIVHAAGIPLNNYIYEANYRYFDQALQDPEVFARWVVTTANLSDNTDPVTTQLIKSGDLKNYYTLVYSTNTRQVYKINQSAMLQEAIDRGYNPVLVPSLNTQNDDWNPSTIYTVLASTTGRPNLVTNTVALNSTLQTSYDTQLRPQYQKGWYVTGGKGSSEDQAYAMEEALDADDPKTFATVWKWTQTHLQRTDYLFSWQFTVNADNSVTIDDPNSATSADTDIAVALLQAGNRWQNPSYTAAGKQVVSSIWTVDSEYDTNGHRHILAGNWGRLTAGFVTNAQAIDPAAYHLFATVDPTDNWDAVATQAYIDLTAISTPSFTGHTQFMPINWAVLDPTTGAFSLYPAEAGDDDISYGSIRAVWYVAQDYEAYHTAEAKTYLSQLTSLSQGVSNGKLCTIYVAGAACYTDSASLAAPVSALQVTNPTLAAQVVANYAVPHQTFTLPASDFFQQSWYWLMLYGWATKR